MLFSDIKINENIKKSLDEIGFLKTTEVQTEAIPFILENNTDLIALAQTGTGKTAAFGIPIIEQINIEKNTLNVLFCALLENYVFK